jgi:hypothetical protein
MAMNLSRLLFLHGVVTLAAGVVLIAVPGAIPGAVGIDVPTTADLVPYMLGAAEIAIAVLSFGASRLHDRPALQLVSITIIVFHLATAAVEALAFAQGGPRAGVWANVAVRVAVVALFAYYGLRKASRSEDRSADPGL